jgi:hypothetical protein
MNPRYANLVAVPLVLAGTFLAGCSKTSGKYADQIRSLQAADVSAEVAAAVSKGDFRFVGVMGLALAVPGVPDYQDKYAAKYGVRVIEHTSDAIESSEHAQLQEVARTYAERYNKLLLTRIPSS